MSRISVALCTYQGARYLEEQLSSIERQTRTPDELLIFDDGSTDESVEIARRFASRVGFAVEVRVNERNLGYVRNFERAIAACSHEVIVLADQDDVWHPERLARTEEGFRMNPAAGLVFSDAELIDGEGRPLGERLWEAVGFTRREAAGAERGAALRGAGARERRHRCDPGVPFSPPSRAASPGGGVTHDAWISLLLAALAPSVMIAEPLVRYRQHAGNQIGARRMSPFERLRRARYERVEGLEIRRLHHRAAITRLEQLGAPSERLQLLRDSVTHLDARIGLPKLRTMRLPAITREATTGRYGRASEGLSSAVRDLLA
jgi:glycosyltransferase involved in cell wall biosynthesis